MMDESELFWSEFPHIGEFASPEDIARLEAPATVELALGACRRKLRFYFLTDEREPRVPYDKRKRKRFVKRFPLSDYSAATNWVEAAMLAGYTPGIQGTEISFVPRSTVEACRWIASKRSQSAEPAPVVATLDPHLAALSWLD